MCAKEAEKAVKQSDRGCKTVSLKQNKSNPLLIADKVFQRKQSQCKIYIVCEKLSERKSGVTSAIDLRLLHGG